MATISSSHVAVSSLQGCNGGSVRSSVTGVCGANHGVCAEAVLLMASWILSAGCLRVPLWAIYTLTLVLRPSQDSVGLLNILSLNSLS